MMLNTPELAYLTTRLLTIATTCTKLTAFLVDVLSVDVNTADWNGNTTMHILAENPDRKVMDFLLSRGADVNQQNKQKCTPLMLVTEKRTEGASRGCKALQRKLIDAGASLTIPNMWGLTPLDLDPKLGQTSK